MNQEVAHPILNSPFESPARHWHLHEGGQPEMRDGRRPAMDFCREPGRDQNDKGGFHNELKIVNRIRERVKAWREQGWPGVTRTTHDLLTYWRRAGREKRLFFAPVQAAEHGQIAV